MFSNFTTIYTPGNLNVFASPYPQSFASLFFLVTLNGKVRGSSMQPSLCLQACVSSFPSLYLCTEVVQQVHLQYFLGGSVLILFIEKSCSVYHHGLNKRSCHKTYLKKNQQGKKLFFLTKDCTISALNLFSFSWITHWQTNQWAWNHRLHGYIGTPPPP